MSTTVQFPSEQAIVSYLEQHNLTNDAYYKEKKIIETVAKFFANSSKHPDSIGVGVRNAMEDLNEKIRLPMPTLMLVNFSLTKALKDCAKGKPIALEIKKKD